MTITRVQNWPFPLDIDNFEAVSEYLILLYRSLQEDSVLRIEDFQSALHGRVLGEYNTLLGIDAGYSLTTGTENTLLGHSAGYSITSGVNNTAIGRDSLYTLISGFSNVAVGWKALYTTTATWNTAVGVGALFADTTGSYNTAVGYLTLLEATEGDENTAIGHAAGGDITTTSENVYIGDNAGSAHTGSSSIFIGHDAGRQVTTGDNLLYMDNSNTATPLIYGEFDNDLVRIHNRLDISDTTDNHIIKAVQETGLGGRLTIGLDETARRMVICDAGDIDTDFGLSVSSNPILSIFHADGNLPVHLDYNSLNFTTASTVSITTTGPLDIKADAAISFTLLTDISANHGFYFDSGANIQLTDADAEQAWVSIEPKINQTSTANYVGLLMDVTETSTGSGTNELVALRVATVDKFTIDNSGNVIAIGNIQSTTHTFPSEYNNGNSGATATIDWNNGQEQKITLDNNCTLTFTAPTVGVGMFRLRIIQDGTGNRTITWPGTVKWPDNGTAPTLSTGAGLVDKTIFDWNGTSYYGGCEVDYA